LTRVVIESIRFAGIKSAGQQPNKVPMANIKFRSHVSMATVQQRGLRLSGARTEFGSCSSASPKFDKFFSAAVAEKANIFNFSRNFESGIQGAKSSGASRYFEVNFYHFLIKLGRNIEISSF
jgi:hypothetical protein